MTDLDLTQRGVLKKTLRPPIFPFTHISRAYLRLSPRLSNSQLNYLPKGYLLEHQTHCRRGGHSTSHQNLLRLTSYKDHAPSCHSLVCVHQAAIQLPFSLLSFIYFVCFQKKKEQDQLETSPAAEITTFTHRISSKPFISTSSPWLLRHHLGHPVL